MSGVRLGICALTLVLAALLSDWVWAELFLRRDSLAHVGGALMINAAVLALSLVGASMALPRRALVVGVRTAVIVGFCVLLLVAVRAAIEPGSHVTVPFRLGLAVVTLAAAAVLAMRIDDALADRLMRALAIASLAFILTPAVWRLANPAPPVWIGPASTTGARAATIFLLLDEMGYEAAAPLAADLRKAGLEVRFEPRPAAGENTMNAIPALFAGTLFPRVRPCGLSSLCSGFTSLDFSRIRVMRPDVFVTGLLVPYCDIEGLRSCFQLPLPHEFGSAYRSLAVFYWRRLGLTLPEALKPPVDPPGIVGHLLDMQVQYIDRSAFWNEGGVLYAHLPIPHPPGRNGAGTLDADYADNLQEARIKVRDWSARAARRFGRDFSIVITSDHPLRSYWCSSGLYPGAACQTRAAFQSAQVPIIVASPGSVSTRPIASIADVFGVLNDQAGSIRP